MPIFTGVVKFILFHFNRKHEAVRGGVRTLRASKQVLCNVWSYDFYDMMLCITAMP